MYATNARQNAASTDVRKFFFAPTPLTLIFLMLMVLPGVPRANVAVSETCDRVARLAARDMGVPVAVMLAITRTETGRQRDGRLVPWPWTVNMEGKGIWFDRREEALAYVLANHRAGKRSFDVGCFQLNYRWHGDRFDSLAQMFEPEENARYAARFLVELYVEKGSWSEAAAAYHSRTPKYANRYRARFERILAKLSAAAPDQPLRAVSQQVSRQNTFPLLQRRDKAVRLGSLVPLGPTNGRPLFGQGG